MGSNEITYINKIYNYVTINSPNRRLRAEVSVKQMEKSEVQSATLNVNVTLTNTRHAQNLFILFANNA